MKYIFSIYIQYYSYIIKRRNKKKEKKYFYRNAFLLLPRAQPCTSYRNIVSKTSFEPTSLMLSKYRSENIKKK